MRKKQYCGDTAQFEKDCEEILISMMAACSEAFEKLPLVQDVAILENILYDGVWNRFDKKKKEAAAVSLEINEDGEKNR